MVTLASKKIKELVVKHQRGDMYLSTKYSCDLTTDEEIRLVFEANGSVSIFKRHTDVVNRSTIIEEFLCNYAEYSTIWGGDHNGDASK